VQEWGAVPLGERGEPTAQCGVARRRGWGIERWDGAEALKVAG
jgi:hypothetical protein